MPEQGDTEPPKGSLLKGLFCCCFPDSTPPAPNPPADPHVGLAVMQQDASHGGVVEDDDGPTEDDGVAAEDNGIAAEDDGVAAENDGVAAEDDGGDNAVRLKDFVGITYNLAKIIAGNFPLPGLQSLIALIDYVKNLHEVMYCTWLQCLLSS